MVDWKPTQRTLRSISQQTKDLIARFDNYTSRFEEAFSRDKTFGGPSLYFHFQCIKKYSCVPLEAKFRDERFFEYIYAVLASWGMHRMGTDTRLRSYHEFKREIISQRDRLSEIASFQIWKLDPSSSHRVLATLQVVLDAMKISKSSAHLVANTKVLHHILPELVPPVDRSYTLAYFGINKMLPSQKPAGVIFKYLFPAFVRVATCLSGRLVQNVDLHEENWHTSPTKVIDNVLIGAMLK